MKTALVVCEYNPFHLGHARQIEEIKKALGEDTAIVAVMSGNYVERGDFAIMHKYDRAKAAVKNGVSLVLELPFPFSASGAEFFGAAAVSIGNDLGIIDYISFGSECGDASLLSLVAERISSYEFEAALRIELKNKDNSAKGYASVYESVYRRLYGEEGVSSLRTPNDILAISYLKALKKLSSSIKPLPVRREGTDKDSTGEKPGIAGATYIRNLLLDGKSEKAFSYLPEFSQVLWKESMVLGEAPVAMAALEKTFLSHLRLCEDETEFAECGGGLYRHIVRTAKKSNDLSALLANAATKKYTDARIRRAILFSYFGVTPAMLREKPAYTQVLAMDAKGQDILRRIRNKTNVPILTKPADTEKLPPVAREQASRAYRADSVYTLAMPLPQAADFFIRKAPFLL